MPLFRQMYSFQLVNTNLFFPTHKLNSVVMFLNADVMWWGPCTPSPKLLYAFFQGFLYSSSFPIKMLVTDAKTQKIEPDPIFFMAEESFGGSV